METLTVTIAGVLVDAFGRKPFTFAMLSKVIETDLSRRAVYAVMHELVGTGLVTRVKVDKGSIKVAGWMIKTDDEDNAIQLWAKYLSN